MTKSKVPFSFSNGRLRLRGLLTFSLDVLVCAATFFCIVHFRQASILYPFPLNPDEAQAVANTFRILSQGYSWDSFDGTTAGPFNSIILLWPNFFGADVTFFSTRITAALLVWAITILLYLYIKKTSSRILGVALILPLNFFYACTGNWDFLHYSSELLALFLLVLSIYFLLLLQKVGVSKKILFILGVALSSVPFCKLQATPIAFVIGAYAIFLIASDQVGTKVKASKFSLFIAGIFCSPILMFTPLVAGGGFIDFWNSYIIWATTYVREPLSILDLKKLIEVDWIFNLVVYFYAGLWGFLFLLMLVCIKFKKINIFSKPIYFFICILLIFISTIFSIVRPGNAFPHYLHFLLPIIVICVGTLTCFYKKIRYFYFLFFIFYFILLFQFYGAFKENFKELNLYPAAYKKINSTEQLYSAPRILSWLPFEVNYMLVWGWMPQWYAWSGISPATRESHTYAQIVKTSLSEYFQKRFMVDLLHSNPEIIVDAVGGRSFGFNDSNLYSPKSFTEFSNFLANGYIPISNIKNSDKCPQTYIRKDLEQSILDAFITPLIVTASKNYPSGSNADFGPEHLFDFSLTEDSCIDYWLLPDGELGNVKIDLARSELVEGLMILNTRNSTFLDRGSEDVTVSFLGSNRSSVVNVKLNPYPYWTKIVLPTPFLTNQIVIDIDTYIGKGGGLNEIKIMRFSRDKAP